MSNQIENSLLHPQITGWFKSRGWQPRAHQIQMLAATVRTSTVLLTAPTGGGKTLAGFLPSLQDLIVREAADPTNEKLHTLYVSPLKALAVDIARNLETPVSEMQLDIRIESRSGDTPQSRRQRQRQKPPQILLTTPEQIALLLSFPEARELFGDLRYVIIDEAHSFAGNKRGDLLALDLARLARLAPAARRLCLSATIFDAEALAELFACGGDLEIIRGAPGPRPQIDLLIAEERIPWAGHYGRYSYNAVYDAIAKHGTTLVFVNTRALAEIIFHELWRLNEETLAIALHHGSLAPEQRRKVEAAMSRGDLRAVVCTSTLDLGVDWGAVDLVIQMGAPKGLSRLTQRIGRANHQLHTPSKAMLVPSNRFEVLECQSAADAVAEGELDDEPLREGALEVLAQHILGLACSEPFDVSELYDEITRAGPYRDLRWEQYEEVVDFVATGGYALRRYDRYQRIRKNQDGKYEVVNGRVARQYRMNAGTIVQSPMIKVRFRRGRALGEIEEGFIEQLVIGDTFAFAGEILRFEGLQETSAIVSRSKAENPQVQSYYGGKFPLSTFLAERVRQMIGTPERQTHLPQPVKDWLRMQTWRSVLPRPGELLIETFPRGRRQYLVAYAFEGRLAHQSLGMLLTRRMERNGDRPMGFVASEYALAVWSLRSVQHIDALFSKDMLGDDLEEWLAESNLMKRSFRNVAVIAGLIERRHPGQEKSGRQMTFSSDLIYDVLRQYEPNHILMQATRDEAARGLLDIRRLADFLVRIQGNIRVQRLNRVSPLAVPLMLEIGKEAVHGEAMDDLLDEAADDLIEEATRLL